MRSRKPGSAVVEYIRGALIGLALITLGMCACMGTRPIRYVTVTNRVEAAPLRLLADDYLHSEEFAPANTLRAKRVALASLLEFLSQVTEQPEEKVLWYDLTHTALERYRDAGDYSASTVRQRLFIIKHFAAYASNKFAVSNPAVGVSIPSPAPRKFKGLLDREHAALVSYADTLEPRNRFLILFLLGSGLRESEAANARLSDLSPTWDMLAVVGKGGKPRNVPISTSLRRSLVQYRTWRDENYPTREVYPLLVSSRGANPRWPESYQMSVESIADNFKRACLACGVAKERAHPHTARHDFAIRTLAHLSPKYGAGKALNLVALMLGHSDIKITMQYLNESDDELLKAVEDM